METDIQGQAHRKFYDLPVPEAAEGADPVLAEECAATGSGIGKNAKKFRSKSAFFRGNAREVMEMVDRNIIGRETVFQGPFGPRRCKFLIFEFINVHYCIQRTI
jgi:hypothetical protein